MRTAHYLTAAVIAAVVAACGTPSAPPQISTVATTDAPAPAASAVTTAINQRVVAMWPDIARSYGGAPQIQANKIRQRLGPRTGTIGTNDELVALDGEYRKMQSEPANPGQQTQDSNLLTQDPAMNFTTTPTWSAVTINVCYSYPITPVDDATKVLRTDYRTADLGLRNPGKGDADLADPSMWGLISVTNVNPVSECLSSKA